MRKLFLVAILMFSLSSTLTLTGCRETKADDVADDIEDVADDIGDKAEDVADDVSDALDDN